jgi:WD40 repeat protein
MKAAEWKTLSCKFGWQVRGIWPGVDYTDVNAVARSQNQLVLATADDFGKVKLFKYPCYVEKAQFNEYNGHSSHVTKVKFSAGDNYVVSTGGNDKTVLIWQTDFGDAAPGLGGAGAASQQ